MKKLLSKFTLLILLITTPLFAQPPRLTIVLVVDQLAYHFFMRHAPYFTGAFKELLQDGIVYDQANFPHGMPSTATGHTALSTGTYAHNHGIIGNYWYNKEGTKKLKAYIDSPEDAALFIPGGISTDRGYSCKNLLVDGISDQYMMASKNNDRAVYSFSLKSRAAMGMGNHRGKNIWFDFGTGRMTSSKAFFDQLPGWLNQFNATNPVPEHRDMSWQLMYSPSSKQYRFKHAQDDQFSSFKENINKRRITLIPKPGESERRYAQPYEWFEVMPSANQYVLDCAYTGIRNELPHYKQMLVWVSVSSIDKLGHRVGCQNIALMDMLYQLDMQIKSFMSSIKKLLKRKESVAYVLTADHGVMPIPQLLALDGYPAKRLDSDKIIASLNEQIKATFGVESLVKAYKTPQFFLDEIKLGSLPSEQQEAILQEITAYIKTVPGIRHAWTFDELNSTTYPKHSFEEHFKMQLYPGRSGRITIQTDPYVLMTDYVDGTGHKTPYNYDTQVPLIIHRKNMLEKKHITSKVWTTQLAASLASILEVPRPSAATFGLLPEIADR